MTATKPGLLNLSILILIVSYFGVLSEYYYPDTPPYLAVHDDTFQPDVILRVTADVIQQDCTARYSVIINGSIPAPELRFKEDQKVWIRVYNDMDDENVTIHWHGLTQRMSPFSDGTPAASQWPIPPAHYFDYEFQLRRGDAGTYFYHSHVAFQAVTAGGALIIDEADGKPPFQYDEDRVIMFSDVFHLNDSYIIQGLLQKPFRWSGEINNVALNGKSRGPNATVTQAGPSCEQAVIEIQPDKVYRFRFIGAAALSQVFVAFEEHLNLVLIEVDGRYILPHVVDHLEVHSGQRYSAILFAKTAQELRQSNGGLKNRFWIQMTTRSRPLVTTAYGILSYGLSNGPVDTFSVPQSVPINMPNETYTDGWLEDKLRNLYEDPEDTFPTLQEVTRRVTVYIQQGWTNGTAGFVSWYQNHYPWFENFPKEPYLVSLYKNETRYFPNYGRAMDNEGFDPVTRTFPARIGEVLEIVWVNLGNNFTGVVETHPMHVHGDHFWDAGTGSGNYDPVANEARLQKRRGRFLMRDTSNLYRTPLATQTLGPGAVYSWRAMRIRVRNPGVWMLHCHILQHMVMGMQTVWVFGEKKDLTPVPKHLVQGYLTYGGSAYGNKDVAPRVLHYWHN